MSKVLRASLYQKRSCSEHGTLGASHMRGQPNTVDNLLIARHAFRLRS